MHRQMGAEAVASKQPESRLSGRGLGIMMAALCTITAAAQPTLMRYGAVRLDPMLFGSGCAVVATLCVLPVLYVRG